jgi:ADP-ribose pyrophosphatase YjhB (NUDIX family)
MIRPTVAVGVVLLDGERVLVIRRKKPPAEGLWSVPGGKVELGESLEAACLRELREETGLSATIGPLVEVLDRVLHDPAGTITYHYVILDFVGTAPVGELCAASDAAEARWVTFAELAHLPTTDGLGPVLERARVARDGGRPVPHRASEV